MGEVVQCTGAPSCTICFLIFMERSEDVIKAIYGHLVLSECELARHQDSFTEIERDPAGVLARVKKWLLPVILEKVSGMLAETADPIQAGLEMEFAEIIRQN